jgi:hypothetical protein
LFPSKVLKPEFLVLGKPKCSKELKKRVCWEDLERTTSRKVDDENSVAIIGA